ncbi:hypothetical protein J3E72DRAFT_360882, partial [Bipolaris maydis]
MYLYSTLVLPVLWSVVVAKQYDYCACQYSSNGQVYFSVVDRIAADCSNPYVYGQGDNELWIPAPNGWGPKFSGRYLKNPNGKIDGPAFYDLCSRSGAGDSTCFDCGATQS